VLGRKILSKKKYLPAQLIKEKCRTQQLPLCLQKEKTIPFNMPDNRLKKTLF